MASHSLLDPTPPTPGMGCGRTRAQTRQKNQDIANEAAFEINFGKLNVTNIDARLLLPGEDLNDTLIDFFLKMILKVFREEVTKDVPKPRQVHAFSSLFYTQLKKDADAGNPFTKLLRWSKDIEILKQDILVLPICSNKHWYLTLILNPYAVMDNNEEHHMRRPRMLYLNSLCQGAETDLENNRPVYENVTMYLQAEARCEGEREAFTETIQEDVGLVPMQKNQCDCGVFILEYVTQILLRPSILRRLGTDNLSDWFQQSLVTWRRDQLKFALLYLAKLQEENKVDNVDDLLEKDEVRARLKQFFTSKPQTHRRRSVGEEPDIMTVGLAKVHDEYRLFVKVGQEQHDIEFNKDSSMLACIINTEREKVKNRHRTFCVPSSHSLRDVIEKELTDKECLVIGRRLPQGEPTAFSDDDVSILATLGYDVTTPLGPDTIIVVTKKHNIAIVKSPLDRIKMICLRVKWNETHLEEWLQRPSPSASPTEGARTTYKRTKSPYTSEARSVPAKKLKLSEEEMPEPANMCTPMRSGRKRAK